MREPEAFLLLSPSGAAFSSSAASLFLLSSVEGVATTSVVVVFVVPGLVWWAVERRVMTEALNTAASVAGMKVMGISLPDKEKVLLSLSPNLSPDRLLHSFKKTKF